jgi:hypothetical protein
MRYLTKKNTMRYGFPNKGIVKRRIDQIPTIKKVSYYYTCKLLKINSSEIISFYLFSHFSTGLYFMLDQVIFLFFLEFKIGN